jgi:dethiobiotin synthetase
MNNIVFVCGTDTGSGKTVLTGLLTRFCRNNGIDAVAIKPFCSGSREDVEFLRLFQDSQLTNEEINPWFFNKPLAPYADLKQSGEYNFKKP